MSTISWKGDAPAVAQVDLITVSGTWAANDTLVATINGKTVTFTVLTGSTAITDVIAGFVAAWNATTAPKECLDATAAAASTTTITLTASVAGVPFTLTSAVATTAGNGDVVLTHPTVSSGPADANIATNYAGNVLPSGGDTLVFENNGNHCLYNLDSFYTATKRLSITRKHSYTGYIGLPYYNSRGYVEYRQRYLQVGGTAVTAITVTIGEGAGNGSGRTMLDFVGAATTCTIYNTGSPVENGIKAVLIKGTHASANVLNITKGSVGVAMYSGEASTFTITTTYQSSIAGDVDLAIGPGTTVTALTMFGGSVDFDNSAATCPAITQYDGKLTLRGNQAVTALTQYGGAITDICTGTITTADLHGSYDHSSSFAGKYITTCNLYAGAVFNDPEGSVTTSGTTMFWQLKQCSLNDVKIYRPANRRYTDGTVV